MKKATAKKTTAKKTTAKKSTTKKAAAKKSASKKSTAKKSTKKAVADTSAESDAGAQTKTVKKKRATKTSTKASAARKRTTKTPAANASPESNGSVPKRKQPVKKRTTSSADVDGFAAGLLDDIPESAEPKQSAPKKKSTKKSASKKTAAKKSTAKKTTAKKKAPAKADPESGASFDDDSRTPAKQQPAPKSKPPRESDSRGGKSAGKQNDSQKDKMTTTKSAPRSDSGPKGQPNSHSGDDDRPKRRRRRGGKRNRNKNQNAQQNQQSGGKQGGYQKKKQYNKQKPVHNDEVTGQATGVLELHPNGYGFLRDPEKNYASQDDDAFVSSSFVERYKLREGVLLYCDIGPGGRNKGPRVKGILEVENKDPDSWADVAEFDEKTPIMPYQRLKLEVGKLSTTTRVIDLVAPVGKGQRALVVAPPRTGKTMLIQAIAEAISINHPEVHLMMLLIDERPEEVTEMRRQVDGEVIASSMDQEIDSHTRVSRLVFERGQRLAEQGKDVVILFDSITRAARAFNKRSGGGATGSGGIGIKALEIPRKLFGTARQFEEGGSLTVIATALVDTGSRGDEAIFQEFKGTGNMELMLSRELADRRIWPAINVSASGTRREEVLLSEEAYEGTVMMRRMLATLRPVEAMQQLLDALKRFDSNEELLEKIRTVL